jgi:hypothetical protein
MLLFPAIGAADTPGLQSFANPSVWPNNDNQDWSLGWEFAVSGSVTVDALGYNYFGVPLNNSHQVGIFNSAESLLESATVTNASSLDDGYLYTSLATPLVLTTGDYWISGTTLGLNDGWIYNADSIVTAPSITYVDSWYAPGSGGVLSFPSTSTAGGRQYLEVNFLTTSVVPEPATIAILGSGLLMLAGFRRRELGK